jgi:Domain of unknown function (DUF4430)
VLRRTVVVTVAVLGVALALAAGAFAATVKIRVEGRTQSIFGSSQPTVRADNALQALEAASAAGEFYYLVTTASFGQYVSQIGRYAAAGNSGWVFKVNGVSPPVGADQVALRDGDTVLWYWAEFGDTGGPPTLDLRRLPANCYLVASVDDKGARQAAAGATLSADGRRVRTNANGRGCIGRHAGLVRATLTGAVRSNAVR